MKIRPQQIMIGVGLILLMTFLFIKTNVIESETHNRFGNHLRQLKELDATLDKDVLKSRYGLLNTYDLLITENDELNNLQLDLKKAPFFLGQDEQERIDQVLNEFGDLQNQKELLIEHFKSRNAILNNSLRYFPVAVSNLKNKVPATHSQPKESELLNYLLRDILTYYLLTDKELEPVITNHFSYNETPLFKVLEDLEKTYKLEIVLENEKIKNCLFTGDLSNQNMFNKLESICVAFSSSYEIKGTRILLKSGKDCD